MKTGLIIAAFITVYIAGIFTTIYFNKLIKYLINKYADKNIDNGK